MAHSPSPTSQVEEYRSYLEGVAKNLADKLWGPQGPPWGTKLSQLEDLVVALRDILSEKTLALLLERQACTPPAARPAAFQVCSGCGRPADPDPNEPTMPRIVQTRGGEAAWSEPKHYCRPCRQAFFPSVQEPRLGSGALQQRDSGQDHLRRQ
jgi:hypothetical protein